MTPQELFLANLALIEELIAEICRLQKVPHDQHGDVASFVKMRLVADDYRVLRRFQGRSTLKTYLITVLHRLVLDYAKTYWGRWRPSAEARRGGPVAVQLEILLHRDGLEPEDAYRILSEKLGRRLDRRRLEEVARLLPPRQVGTTEPAGVDALVTVATAEQEQLSRADSEALRALFLRLGAEDRLLLRLRYDEELPVHEIAAFLDVDRRRLYHRYEAMLAELRRGAEEAGLEWGDVFRLVESGVDLARLLREPQPSTVPGADRETLA